MLQSAYNMSLEKKPRKKLEVAWCHRRSCVATLIQLLNQHQSKGIDKQGQGATERGEGWGHNFISFDFFVFVSLPFSPGCFFALHANNISASAVCGRLPPLYMDCTME